MCKQPLQLHNGGQKLSHASSRLWPMVRPCLLWLDCLGLQHRYAYCITKYYYQRTSCYAILTKVRPYCLWQKCSQGLQFLAIYSSWRYSWGWPPISALNRGTPCQRQKCGISEKMWDTMYDKFVLFTNRKLYMGFLSIPKSVSIFTNE